MSDTYTLVSPKQYIEESRKWLMAVKRRENVLVNFFPKTDRLLRSQQLTEDKARQISILGDKTKYIFLPIEFTTQNVEDKHDMQMAITSQLNHMRLKSGLITFDEWINYFNAENIQLVLVIQQIEKLWNSEGQTIQNTLSLLLDEYRSLITVLSFTETDITHPAVAPFLPDSMRLYENIYLYPLYNQADSLVFINYLEKKWDIDLGEKNRLQVVRNCGGHFWLLKEAVREKDTDTNLSDGLKFRLDIIYKSLQHSEQDILAKTIRRKKFQTPIEKHSLEYLQKMQLFDNAGKCSIGLFKNYILEKQENLTEMVIRDDRLLLNQVPVDKFFSRKEYRVIKLLLENKGQIISREVIAKHIWPTHTETHYSDWAIDQLIARVRRRLLQLSISPKLLQSVRGKGYLLKLS